MTRRFAISDIHGCAATLRHLVDNELKVSQQDELYLLGDYINRGPDSWGVIDAIWEWQAQGIPVVCLRGNHEDRFLWNHEMGRVKAAPRYLQFMRGLPSYHLLDTHILVHAGLNFMQSDPLQDQWSMRWIRNWAPLLDREWLGNRTIIHGHVRQKRPDIEQSVHSRVPIIGIDNGCFALHATGEGALCALELNTHTLHFQQNIDMTPALDNGVPINQEKEEEARH